MVAELRTLSKKVRNRVPVDGVDCGRGSRAEARRSLRYWAEHFSLASYTRRMTWPGATLTFAEPMFPVMGGFSKCCGSIFQRSHSRAFLYSLSWSSFHIQSYPPIEVKTTKGICLDELRYAYAEIARIPICEIDLHYKAEWTGLEAPNAVSCIRH